MFKKVLNIFGSEDPPQDNDSSGDSTTEDASTNDANMSAEEIRNRRLERFALGSPQSPPKIIEPIPVPQEKKSEKKIAKPAEHIEIPKNKSPKLNTSTPSCTTGSLSPNTISPLQWEDKIIRKIFSVTLEPEQQTKEIFYLRHMVGDLREANEPLSLTTSHLDRIIIEQIQFNKRCIEAPVNYLLSSEDSLTNEKRRIRNNSTKTKIIGKIEQVITNYFILLISQPEFLVTHENHQKPLHELLEAIIFCSLPSSILPELVKQLEEQGKLGDIFIHLFHLLHEKARNASLVDDSVTEIIGTFCDLMKYKSIAKEIITNDPHWLGPPSSSGNILQYDTHLGTLLSYGCIPTKQSARVAVTHFSNPSSLSRNNLEGVSSSLRTKNRNYIISLHQCILGVIKSCKVHGKEAWLSFTAQMIQSNVGIRKLRPDLSQLSDINTLINLGSLCLQFCRPIISQGPKAFSRIDPAYLQSNIRISVEGDTKLSVNSEELEKWVDKRNLSNIETWKRKNPGLPFDESKFKRTEQAGFTTECFFLTYRALHIGILKAQSILRESLSNSIRDLRNRRDNLIQTQAPQQEIEHAEKQVQSVESVIQCYHVHLYDVNLVKECGQFYLFSVSWLLNLIDPKRKGLPLPEPTMEYGTMPEFIIEDIVDFISFGLRVFPAFLSWFAFNDLISLIILLVGSPAYVKNPYLRAKVLGVITQFIRSKTPGQNSDIVISLLASDSFVRDYLAEVLMVFYVDIEQTGHHNQYTSKFYIRQDITVIIKQMWEIPVLHDSILAASKGEKFEHFIFKVLDDSIFFLEDGLRVLTEIHHTQVELKDRVAWNKQTSEEQEEKLETYRKNESRAKALFSIADGTVDMLRFLTTEIVEPFLTPVLVSRIANMLNYFLEQLVGPKCSELRVDNREKYSFNPKQLLGTLIDIYLNLWRPTLVTAVGKDKRCYSHNAFLRARDIIQKHEIRSLALCQDLVKFADDVKNSLEEEFPEDLEFPDEFLDPIMQEVMKDPVKLPSGLSMDRSVITTHLLTKETDPFTNLPLTKDDLVPNDELREKIEAFIREHTKK